MEAQRIAEDNSPFTASRERFDRVVERLRSGEVGAMTHSEVEAIIRDDGRDLLRQLFQDHVDLRAEREQAAPRLHVVGEDGIDRPHHRDTGRRLISLLGEILVQRIGRCAGRIG